VTDVFRFAILGLGAGALYSIAAVGLVLVYRGSGVVNFAQGAMGMVGAYVFFEVRQRDHLPALFAIALGLLACAALGAAFHILVLRRMRNASTLAKIVATLALLVLLQDLIYLRFGQVPQIVTSILPTDPIRILGVEIGQDRLYIFGIVTILTIALWAVYKFSTFGVATSAVAENPRVAAALAVSPNLIAAVNWAVGATLGGLAAILLVPITSLSSDLLSLIVIPILAAAIVGRFSSFPITLLAGLGIGIAQSEVTRWVSSPGWPTAVPFFFVALSLIRGKAIARKDESFGRMPSLGTGRLSPGLVLLGGAGALLFIWEVFPAGWLAAAQLQMILAIVLMSYVVVTGFTGQASLMQMGFAGMGAVVAARFFNIDGWSMQKALLGGVIAMIPIAIIVGLAGVRTRGVQLAIVTLGLAYSLDAVVFGNPAYSGGLGYVARIPRFFGINVDTMTHPQRYATLTLVLLVLVGVVISNLRRGRTGRRLIAVRTNERAAMALGVSVTGAKLYAFAVGGMIAAIGGILIAFDPLLAGSGDQFAGIQSVNLMQVSVFGGVGYLSGPLIASTLQGGTLGQQLLSFLGGKAAFYLSLASAAGLLLMLPVAPDGLAALARRPIAGRRTGAPRLFPKQFRPTPPDEAPPTLAEPVARRGHTLRIENLSVRYGGVIALADLTLELRPGEVVGLIGPNGSGKTTAIDAITGFVTPAGGTVAVGGERINRWSPGRRARAGVARSFQSLELFDDLTVLENVQAACDSRDVWGYMTDLVHPGRGGLTPRARAALVDFGLQEHLQTQARHLNYAQRRLLAVSRAVAGGGSILLLDEPAAGLSEVAARSLSACIRRLADTSGIGVLLIEHNVDMVMRTCDRVIALDFGVVIGQGTPDEVRRNPAVIAAYLGARFREEPVGGISGEPV
jgi:ABC-type branched-subunit amino acid transport system ATPase component/branched-subunit amino acid ABC-type transport system permease component